MLAVADNVEGALTLELGVTFTMECTVIVLVGSVDDSTGGAFLDAYRHTLAVLNIDGRTCGVGNRHTAQLYSTFI